MRSIDEIKKAEKKLFGIVWWNRHKLLEENKETMEREGRWNATDEIWKAALKKAKEVEKEIPEEERALGEIEWGMVNGKLSALRWVLDDEWDNLDT